MTPALYLTFVVLTAAFCITPGPSIMLVSSQAMARGFGAGVRTTAGMQTGAALYWIASALGLTAVLMASERAFMVIKYAGAACLIVLGALMILGARKKAEARASAETPPLWRGPYMQGLVGHLANPKAVLFYAAFLPQFITPNTASLSVLLLLAATAIAIDTAAMLAYAWASARSGKLMRDVGAIMWRQRIAGAAQIAVGGILAAMRKAA
jgi:homoserine/homoserine lactone efflux protein